MPLHSVVKNGKNTLSVAKTIDEISEIKPLGRPCLSDQLMEHWLLFLCKFCKFDKKFILL